MTESNPLRRPALGWPVFPLSPGTMVPPQGTQAFEDATTDPKILRGWWARWPGANIGLACGAAGLVVIDADVKPIHVPRREDGIQMSPLQERENGRKGDSTLSFSLPGRGEWEKGRQHPPLLPSRKGRKNQSILPFSSSPFLPLPGIVSAQRPGMASRMLMFDLPPFSWTRDQAERRCGEVGQIVRALRWKRCPGYGRVAKHVGVEVRNHCGPTCAC